MPKHDEKQYLHTLNAIREFRDRNGYAPTMREIRDAAGLSSTSVASYHVMKLREKGHLRTTPGIARGIVITEPEATADREKLTQPP